MSVHCVTDGTCHQAVAFTPTHPELQDIVFLNGITAAPSHSQPFSSHAATVLVALEVELSRRGMDKHHIVDVKVTFMNIAANLVAFNKLWDKWTSSTLQALPTMTACQLEPRSPHSATDCQLFLSVTATKARKISPASLHRSGGGEPSVKLTGGQLMHQPWSQLIQAGDVAWLAGGYLCSVTDDVGEETSLQTRAILDWVASTLAAAGMSKDSVVCTQVLVPITLSQRTRSSIAQLCNDYGEVCIIPVAATCAGAKVEITCMASHSPANWKPIKRSIVSRHWSTIIGINMAVLIGMVAIYYRSVKQQSD